jgi:hypothetical protein
MKRPKIPHDAVEIYGCIIEIRAEKSGKSNFPKELFKHQFKGKSKAKIYGLPDGTLLIAGERPLWKMFEYTEADLDRR